ncbi:MAG: CoA ester lyase [Alphaproteobacteria bacterium]|nr:CoA ester lyase [Alphaproteobacteria bacterium]
MPGAERDALLAAAQSGADVLIQELEDFTPPQRRGEARAISGDVVAAWQAAGIVAAVRVNVLDGDGLTDLAAIMPGAPDIVFLPKVARPEHMLELERAVARAEREHGLAPGSTELVANIESARGFVAAHAILSASPRIVAGIGGGEDMAADLGAERSREGTEMLHLRQRFLVEARAAGVVAIDVPYTWTDEVGLEAETRAARLFGYGAKSAVTPDHCRLINRLLTPSADEAARAARMVEAFEAGRAKGQGRVLLDGSLVELPIYLSAKRLYERARAFGVA